MRAAEVYAVESHATRRKVGCVVVKDDTIIAIGVNGTPSGWSNVCEDSATGRTLPEVIHAEQNALDKITRSTVSSVGSSVFVTTAPCIECAKRPNGAKVHAVYYREVYRNDDGLKFLRKCGIHVEQIPEE